MCIVKFEGNTIMKLPFSASYFRPFFISILLLLTLIMALAVTPAAASDNVCGYGSYTLTAGQNIDAGTVEVWHDGTHLYVRYTTTGDWLLEETHVHVAESLAEVPTAGNGQPIPGQFDYKAEHDPPVNTYTHVIPLTWPVDSSVVIVAHASVVQLADDGTVIVSETGFGGEEPGEGNRWWFYIDYHIEPCEEGEGCTPGYWRQAHHYDSWTAPYTPDTIYSAVFMVGPDDRLGDTVQAIGGGLNALLRHSTAALLNAASSDVDYPYTVAEVIAMTQAAINGGDIEGTKDLFDAANNLGCPLS